MGPKGFIPGQKTIEMGMLIIDIPEEEQKNFPVPDKEGEFYKSRLDIEGATEYGRYDFLEACKDMGVAVDK